ncbi:hypothetical protein BD410DRAFT_831670 [Rickenella mellea]|uniref:SAP domain-containing protein n=1 Tax=Rickenella mellea TaxID=50990 RepID=A0A4Y7PP03_9AGAM|nr:hypothetical protein BD410DRAFT_831670 [Rickenella mellea]
MAQTADIQQVQPRGRRPRGTGIIEFLHLPVLQQTLGADGAIQSETISVTDTTTKETIKAWLRDYDLPVSGTRAELLARLRDYSNNRAGWVSIFQVKKKRTRGGVSGSGACRPSAKRARAVFGNEEPVEGYQTKKNAQSVEVPKSATEINNSTALVNKFLSLPFSRAGGQPIAGSSSLSGEVETSVNGLEMHAPAGSPIQGENLQPLTPSTSHYLPVVASAEIPNIAVLQASQQPTLPILSASSANVSVNNSELSSVENTHTAIVGDEELHYNPSMVPDVPVVRFAADLGQLFREWHSSERLQVNGRGIPIKYWPEFYKKRKGVKEHAWAAIRNQWTNWKFIAEERDHLGSDEAFWAKWQDSNGTALNYTAILKGLMAEREAANKEAKAKALQFFHEDLNSEDAGNSFKYEKSGQTHLVSIQMTLDPEKRAIQRLYSDWRVAVTVGSTATTAKDGGEVCFGVCTTRVAVAKMGGIPSGFHMSPKDCTA